MKRMTPAHHTSRLLVTGGTGLLGRELRRLAPDLIAPPRTELDVCSPESVTKALDRHRPEIVIHAAALTKIGVVEKALDRAIETNIIGTARLAMAALQRGFRLVYISTDYVYPGTKGPHREDEPVAPGNVYAWTKFGGETTVRLAPGSLIIRCSFGPRPYEYEKAAVDKITSRLYVDEIAPHILELALSSAAGIINVGAPGRSMLDYARETRPDVIVTTLKDLGGSIPADTSLDLTRWGKRGQKKGSF